MLDPLFDALFAGLPDKVLIALAIALLYVVVIGGLIYFFFVR
jgi:hypothetical protein